MYTEIKEAVAFLFRFYRNNLPRRRVSLLMAEFGSLLALKYQETWDINDPKKGEEIRMVDFCQKDQNGAVLDRLFAFAADMMVCPEILTNTPDIRLYVNPGCVYYTCQRESNPTFIWTGDVNADNGYQPVALGSMNNRPAQRNMLDNYGLNVYVSGDAMNMPTPNSAYEDASPLILHLVDCHPLINPSPIGKTIKRFVYFSPDHKPTSVAGFAKTRFGSSKSRPDHDNYRRLQAAAAGHAPLGYHHVVNGGGDFNGEHLIQSFFPPQLYEFPPQQFHVPSFPYKFQC